MKKCFFIIVIVAFFGINGMAQTVADSIILPDVFVLTPNDDGINDFFEVRSEKNNFVLLQIFNRWGHLVFSDEAKICRWDGYRSNNTKTQSQNKRRKQKRSDDYLLNREKVPEGIYYYVAEIQDVSPKITKKGIITVLY